MTLPDAVAEALRPHVGSVRSAESVGGGCIANATRIDTELGRFFLKWSDGQAGRTFEAEAAGLQALREAESPLCIPDVLAVQKSHGAPGFLLMDWVELGATTGKFWSDFGEGLASLHRHTSPSNRYGADVDNFIGRLPQHNAWMENWPAFFRSERLEPQIASARTSGRWKASWDGLVDRLATRMDDVLPASPPASVLHGDLWSGNFIPTSDGRAALIDPATYFGHREADLALTELFGGFDPVFYDAYRSAWALEPGYAERREVYNLYHLVNHLNHFGAAYASQVERTLQQFS